MRRFLLALTVITTTSWSQPAQPQAQPPIVVKVEMPPTAHRDFLGYLQALGPLIAASVAVGVALMQFYLQRQQMKQQLFDKRFEVYVGIRRFLSLAMDNIIHNSNNNTHPPLNHETLDQLSSQRRPAKFLFGSDVSDYLRDVDEHIATEEGDDGSLIHRIGWEDEDGLELVMKWGQKAEQVFRPYLQLHHDRNLLQRFVSRTDRWMDTFDKMMASRYNY